MSYDYKKNGKYRQKLIICTKNYARKRCPPNQLNIKLITKTIKIFVCNFEVTTFVNQMTPIIVILWKENHAKITIIGFMKTGCSKKKDHLSSRKPLWRAKCISIDKWYELYIEMLSYYLTEIKLSDLKNLSLFILKTNIFKIHSQQELSTKRVDSLSCNYSEN